MLPLVLGTDTHLLEDKTRALSENWRPFTCFAGEKASFTFDPDEVFKALICKAAA